MPAESVMGTNRWHTRGGPVTAPQRAGRGIGEVAAIGEETLDKAQDVGGAGGQSDGVPIRGRIGRAGSAGRGRVGYVRHDGRDDNTSLGMASTAIFRSEPPACGPVRRPFAIASPTVAQCRSGSRRPPFCGHVWPLPMRCSCRTICFEISTRRKNERHGASHQIGVCVGRPPPVHLRRQRVSLIGVCPG